MFHLSEITCIKQYMYKTSNLSTSVYNNIMATANISHNLKNQRIKYNNLLDVFTITIFAGMA